MKQVGIIGGAGYTAGELIRILLNHKKVAIKYVYSTTNAGNKVSAVHQDLVGDTDLIFSSKINSNVDVLFLTNGVSARFQKKNNLKKNINKRRKAAIKAAKIVGANTPYFLNFSQSLRTKENFRHNHYR